VTWFGVVNPAAGRSSSPYGETLAVADELGLRCSFRESESPGHVAELVSDAIERGITRFVSVGGDGTSNLVLNAMLSKAPDTRFTFAIVAAGSGSDFVRTFGHERGIREGLLRIARPELDLYPVDVGFVRGGFGTRYFLNALNVGVAAASAARANTLPRWAGSPRYTAAFWMALWRFPNASVEVAIDNHTFVGDAINIVVANGQFFGGGLNIAPRSMLGDGEMDVQVFKGPRRQAFSIMPRVLMGTHLTHKGVRRYSGATIHIEAPATWPVEADGEILGSGSVDIDVVPDAIDFVI
jgi:YegS/Rv2252/BmrU family lipid kinase